MDVSKVKGAEDWDFEMPDYLKEEIDLFIEYIKNGDELLAIAKSDEIRFFARCYDDKKRDLLWDYYFYGGWKNDVN